ncbi:MAG: type II secretion system F family protein [Isosphaeraceae bacterium]|nr:type II secretion system F family protein [Isosphaeraceae bacterium]
MSRDADDPQPPRRPRPKPRDPGAEEPSTFQPNPRKRSPAPSGGPGPDLPAGAPKRKKPGSDSPVGRAQPRALDAPERVPEGPKWAERIFFGRVGTAQLAVFCRQLAAYLDAGVDVVKALRGLEQQFARSALGPVVGRVLQSVRRGDALAEAFAREPQAFDSLFVSMMRVADARGGAPETLKMLAHHYEARLSLIRQARSAMIYPIAVLLIASAVVALLTIWLLPMFASLLTDVAGRGTTLPLPSRILMAFSRFIQTGGWWIFPVVMIGTPVVLFRLYKTAAGKRVMDSVAMRIPVFGSLLRKIDTTRMARTMATLFGAGVDVGASMDLTAGVLHLDPFRRAVRDAKVAVMEGGPLSQALQEYRWFGPDVIAVVESGEETGKLPEALEHLADDYEEQVQYMVKNMGQLVQPLIMIFLGGVVFFIILAVILPYIAILSSLAH